MVQGLLMFDSAGALIVSNRRFNEMFELPKEQGNALALGLTIAQVIDLAQRLTNLAMKNMSQKVTELQYILDCRQAGAVVFELTNGRTFCASCSPMADGGFVITIEDTTEQRRTQDQISHMAHYDALTDLPNRTLFYQKMEDLLGRVPQGGGFGVLSLDLDHFKSVNDTLGIKSGTSCCRRWPNACAAVSAKLTPSLGWAEMSSQSCKLNSGRQQMQPHWRHV